MMGPVATLAILPAQDGYQFYLDLPHDSTASPPDWSTSPLGLLGATKLDSETRAQLHQAIEAVVEVQHMFQSASPPDANVVQPFERLGRLLFSLLPPALQSALATWPSHWPLVLATNEIELPWELLHDGTRPLALTHPLARRLLIPDPARRNPATAPPRRAFLFISNPEGNLPEADREAQTLMEAFDSAPERINTDFLCYQQATRLAVREALASGQYALIHYSGHARPGALKLADGELTAEEIQQTLRGQPFIFLNACQSARGAEDYAGPHTHGLASAFLLGGAAGFLGALWKVFDSGSRQFAEHFYALVRDGHPVGEALQSVRAQTWPDPLWAAFVLFGDPTLRLAGLERRETRPATLLAARLTGRQALFATLGLEAAAEAENQALQALAQIAEKYGGQVHRSPMDSLSVCFGVPKAHEDDAERAIRAALEMERALHAHAQGRASHFDLSIGISSGQVLSQTQQALTGSALHISGSITEVAATLAMQARDGQPLLDEETCRRAERAFTFEAIEPEPTFPSPLRAQRIVEMKRAPVTAMDVLGRQRELAQLQIWWQEASAQQGRVVSLVGMAGVGKTSLARAFKASLPNSLQHWVESVCQPYEQATPYSLLAQLLTGLAHIAPPDDEPTRREKLEHLVQPLLSGPAGQAETQRQEALALLGQIVGLPFTAPTVETLDPKLRQRKLAGLIQAALIHRTRSEPLAIWVDDLHWIDEASLAVLNHILKALGQMRVLLLASHRPDWEPEWTAWGSYRHLPLDDLDAVAQRALIAQRLGLDPPPEAVVEVIVKHTGGNPLFIEAMLRVLQENGTLFHTEGRWQLKAEAETAPVPDRIESVMLARLDQLSEDARTVLHLVAVIGPVFEYPLVAALQDAATRARLEPGLNELTQREIIVETGGWWPNVTYAFRHSLLHQTAYAHLLESFRRVTHRRIAQVLQQQYPADDSHLLQRLAHHYQHSDDRISAIRYGLRAARHAAEAWANQIALEWYGRVLAQVHSFVATPASTTERAHSADADQIRLWQIEALTGEGEARVALGHNAEAIAGYEQALSVGARVVGVTPAHRADLYWKIAIAHHNAGALGAAQTALDAGLAALAEPVGLEAGKIFVWTGLIHYRGGRLAEGLAACQQGIALIEPTASARDLAQAYNLLGILHRHSGNPTQAIQAHEQSLALYDQIKYLPGLERASTNLGCAYQDLGRWDETQHQFEKSAELSERTGEERQRIAAQINLSEIHYLKGELNQSLAASQRALHLAETFGFQDYIGLSSLNLGKVYLKQHQPEQARRYLETSLALFQQLQLNAHAPESLRHLALLNVAQGQLDVAQQQARAAVEQAAHTGPREAGQGQRVLGMIYRERGDLEQAEAHLLTSRSILEDQNAPYELGLTLLELALVRQAQSVTNAEAHHLRVQALADCEQAINLFNQLGARQETQAAEEIWRALRMNFDKH